ncbi:MAG TPA: hypothetical protein VGC86_11245 [Afipia sp.]
MSMHVLNGAPSFHALSLRARKLAADLMMVLWGGSLNQYHPEKYYMRGPGPKWREKHKPCSDGSKLAQIPVMLDHKWD